MPAEIADLNSVLGEVSTDTTVETTDESTEESTDTETTDTETSDKSTDTETTDEATDEVIPETSTKPSATKQDLSKTDYKNLSPKVKQALKENPELRSLFFQNKEYSKIFETPQKAAEIAEKLDLYGGVEKIEADLQEMSTVDQMFAAGDPAVIDTWATMSPEGFNKLMPEAMTKFSNMDPEGWSHIASRIITQSFDQIGLVSRMQEIYKNLEPNSKPAQMIADLYNGYLDTLYSLAKNAPQKTVDPERQKLLSERQEFENQKEQTFLNDLSTEVNKVWTTIQSKELDNYIKGKNLGEDEISILNSNIDARFKKLLAKDETVQKQMGELLRSGDKARYIKYMNAKLDKYMPEATKQVWRAFTGIKGSSAKEVIAEKAKAKTTSGGLIRVNKIPSLSQIDQVATAKIAAREGLSYDDYIMQKNAVVLRNGKHITWV